MHRKNFFERNGMKSYNSFNKRLPHQRKYMGAGILETAQQIYQSGKQLLGKASDIYSSDLAKDFIDKLPSSDENARRGFAGEKHAILTLSNGKQGVANYMGPGTNIIARLERNGSDPGRTASDNVSKMHDIQYSLAQGESDVAKRGDLIRLADKRMINSLDKIAREKRDNPRNIMLGKQLIKAKMAGEDIGLLSTDAFAKYKTLTDHEKNVLLSNQAQMEQQGYGKRELAGEKLKKKLLKKMKTNGRSASKDLPDSHNYTLKGSLIGQGRIVVRPELAGQGLSIPGNGLSIPGNGKKRDCGCGCGKCEVKVGMGAFDIKNLLLKKVIPDLLDNLTIPRNLVPHALINRILDEAIRSDADLLTTIQKLTTAIQPLVGLAKMKSLGIPITGSGFNKLMSKKKKNALMAHLSKGLYNTIHKGKGLKLAGQGFWNDFYSGFKSVFKPFATIAGPIADAMGLPMLGIPLSAVGAIM